MCVCPVIFTVSDQAWASVKEIFVTEEESGDGSGITVYDLIEVI